jgi:type VI secretion system protein ImpL
MAAAWPGDVGSASVSISPPVNTAENKISREGPWAWFRLLEAAAVRNQPEPEKKRVNFKVGERFAIYDLTMGSAINPFRLPALEAFRCPRSL